MIATRFSFVEHPGQQPLPGGQARGGRITGITPGVGPQRLAEA